MKHSKVPENWRGSDLSSRREVLQWLHDHGDEVHDPKGLIVGDMKRDLGRGAALSQLITDMCVDEPDHPRMIEVDRGPGQARRTYMIRIVDDWGLLSQPDRGYRNVKPYQREAVAAEPAGNGDGDSDDFRIAAGGPTAREVADALFVRAVKAANQPSRGAELERLREKVIRLEKDLRECRDNLILSVESEAEQRRQADSMRESLKKLQDAKVREQGRPAKGTFKLKDALSKADQQMLDNLTKGL